MSLLNVSGLAFAYPSTIELFCDATFAVDPSDRLALVGPNGAGKSTLLRILAGDLTASGGSIARRRDLRVASVSQEPSAGAARSLFEFVFEARPDLAALRRRLDEPASPEEYAELLDGYNTAGGYDAETATERILDGLGFTVEERDLPLDCMSGGQRTRAALARGLHAPADLLLLDEPTNHLDIAAREWLERQLAGRAGACIVVSHDRTLLRRVATRVIEIARGRISVFDGGFDEYRAHRALLDRQAWDEYEGRLRRQAAAEQAAQKRTQLAVKVAKAPPGMRASKDFYAAKAAKVARTGRLLRERVEREPEIRKPWEEQPIPALRFPQVRRSGDIALSVSELSKGYGGKRLFSDLSFHLARGGRLAVTGPNGAGKSTLLRILVGEEAADAGRVQFGAHVTVGYYAQDAGSLPADQTALTICGTGSEARTLLGCLKLRPDRVNRPMAELSAGERVKVVLVRLLLSGSNLLLLDEPTNHLEIEAQEALEQALAQFPGTLVMVSHDRSFVEGLGPSLKQLLLGEVLTR
ncbi:MAG TPA: ABC-F family ATP-binding cassette domain-containing protein [Bryobacteraceae bacterium]|nr:ABC-F family ATP-binding cassette domain-containing protein [Bryobacteraceae bacterium]